MGARKFCIRSHEVMVGNNSFDRVKAVIARWITHGSNKSRDRDGCTREPTLKNLQLAGSLMFLTASSDVDTMVRGSRTQRVLAPRWLRGMWMTRGWMGKGIGQGVESPELPILLSGSPLAYLIMVKVHEENH